MQRNRPKSGNRLILSAFFERQKSILARLTASLGGRRPAAGATLHHEISDEANGHVAPPF